MGYRDDRDRDGAYGQGQGGRSGIDDIVELLVGAVLVVVAILFVLSFIDSKFGTNLTGWFWGLLYKLTNGFIGNPS